MAENFTHRTPLQPGQRVAVFPFDAASGATIGYYGTVVHADAASILQSPNFPDAWRYRVSTIVGGINVPGCDILPLEPVETDHRRDTWHDYEICFATSLGKDNDEVHGVCRLAGADFGHFCFRKERQPATTYQLRMITALPSAGRWAIEYRVPLHLRLNRAFVMTALRAILGHDVPPKVGTAQSP